jgi:hypothetical protein
MNSAPALANKLHVLAKLARSLTESPTARAASAASSAPQSTAAPEPDLVIKDLENLIRLVDVHCNSIALAVRPPIDKFVSVRFRIRCDLESFPRRRKRDYG